jgi:twinkle protein
MEMKAARNLQRLCRQLTGQRRPPIPEIQQAMGWLGDKLWLFDLVGTAKIDRMIEVFGYAVRRYQIRHFIVDSLAKCGLAEDDYNAQKLFVEQLVDFAHRYDCHVHLVSHARKGNNEDTPPNRMDVKGTGALTDLVDNVVGVWRNKPKEAQMELAHAEDRTPDPDIERQPDSLLTVSKQRHTGWEGRIQLWFEPESWQYLEAPDAPVARYVPTPAED